MVGVDPLEKPLSIFCVSVLNIEDLRRRIYDVPLLDSKMIQTRGLGELGRLIEAKNIDLGK